MISNQGYLRQYIITMAILLIGLLPACTSSQPLTAMTPYPPTPKPVIPTAASPPPPVEVPITQPATSPPTFTPVTTPSAAASAEPELPAPPNNRTQYKLDATLDYNAHSLVVEETITYTNSTKDTLTSLELLVEAQRYPNTFRLSRISYANGERSFQFRLKDRTLTLSLRQPLRPGETVRFSLAYSLQLVDVKTLPQLRPYPLGYTDLQTNFGDWYPYIPPYEAGKGWIIHPAAIYGETLVYDPADFQVAIRFQGSSGNLVLAAGALPEQDGEWTQYRMEAARSFAWSVSPYYETLTRTLELPGDRSTLLVSYYFPYHAAAGKSLLDSMERSLALFSELFGTYPRPVLSGVQADFIDGMEYDGLFFLSTDYYNWHRETPDDFLTALAAHETAHQWWFSLVGSDQAMEPWLDEALCTYSERLYYERFSPVTLDWWWAYRVNYYEPEGWVDLNVFDVPQVAGQYHLYREPVYLRGAVFLEELRKLIGEEAFFDVLRTYSERYTYRQASTADFFAIVRQNATADLTPLLAGFFLKPVP
jgi:hypothetical protein